MFSRLGIPQPVQPPQARSKEVTQQTRKTERGGPEAGGGRRHPKQSVRGKGDKRRETQPVASHGRTSSWRGGTQAQARSAGAAAGRSSETRAVSRAESDVAGNWEPELKRRHDVEITPTAKSAPGCKSKRASPWPNLRIREIRAKGRSQLRSVSLYAKVQTHREENEIGAGEESKQSAASSRTHGRRTF